MSNEQILYIVSGILTATLITLCFILFSKSRDAKELKEKLALARERLNEINDKSESLAVQNENLRLNLADQGENLAKTATKLESLETTLKERDETISELKSELGKSAKNEDELEREISKLRQNLGTNEQINKEREAQIAYLREDLAKFQSRNEEALRKNSELLQELAHINAANKERELSFKAQQENLKETKERLNIEFQNLADKILEEKSLKFSKHSQGSLELILKPLRERIEGFEKRVNEVHTEATRGNANLEAEIKKVLEVGFAMSKEAQNLTTALKGNNKTAGNWGEAQLEASLQAAGLVAGEHYEAQASYRGDEGERLVPDFVIKMPDDKHLIIDSKVSLIAYERAVSASNEAELSAAMNEHIASLKAHIASLAKKDYSSIDGLDSPDFVLMFVPIEPAYIEAMKRDSELFGYGFERKVVMVSHSTLMPILRTVANLWRIERGNKEAREIARSAGEIYSNVCAVAEALKRLGNTLNTASNHYNDAVTKLSGRQGLYGKVDKFTRLSNKASQPLPQMAELTAEFNEKRLEELANEEKSE